jgi:hypothetical protein
MGRSGCFEEEKNHLPFQGLKNLSVNQAVAQSLHQINVPANDRM